MQNLPRSIIRFSLILSMIAISGALNHSDAQTTSKKSSTTAKRTPKIPVGTEMRVRLENEIDTKKAKDGDTFTAIVLSPEKYMDSTVEGHVAAINQSGKMKGQTQLSLTFDRIRLNNGQTIPIAAQLVQVYDEKSAKEVDEEGNVKSGSQGKTTAKRGVGGAALGAIIGGIAGGGSGAAIGAAVGGGAGAGSTLITGSKKVKLPAGTEILIKTTK
ncbi:MAG: hypothetical protein L0226_17855 [Acidobacteria bacterium]|nr:hypothetical protein [Acidobacteriota bacterium]